METMSGHGNDGAMPSMQLVRLEDVTHTAVQSGAWSDSATWAGGTVPPEGARVQIPEGLSVTVDAVLAPMMETVRVDGTLRFATDTDTQLRVDTLVTAKTGLLEIGTAAEPVEAGVTASILFADDGPVSRDTDPALIGRGALLHGKTVIHGAEKTGFGPLVEGARAGDGTITLAEAPTGWQIGDRITIAGTDAADPLGDEVRVITGIDGATVTLDRALDADHVAPRADLDVHVANLTRNVTFASESEETLHRGHVMFMHTNDAELAYVGFDRLGRSDKIQGLDDWELVGPSEGAIGDVEVMELGGDILRGRYSVHFHEGYGSVEEEGAQVVGSVVTRDPGWGFVNHSSNVDFIANVTHDIGGAAYVTEAGDEIGSFVGNIAIRTHNPEADLNPARQELDPGQEPDARAGTQDYGWQGDGFWLHGANVAVDGNVVSGASGHGYIYWTLGLTQKGRGETLVDVANLPEGGMIGPDGTLVRTKQVPVPSFDGNEAYSVAKGLQIHYLHTDNRDPGDRELGLTVPQAYEAQLQSTFSNLTVWHPRLSGIDAPYSSRLTFEGIDLLGSGDPESTGFLLDHFANQRNFTVTDTTIEGFGTGFAVPRQGQSVIEGLESANLTDLVIGAPHGDPRDLEIRDVDFRPLGGPLSGQEESREPVVLDRFRDMDFDAGQDDGFFDLDPAEQAEVTVGEASARKRLEVEIDPLGDPVYSPFFLPDRVVLEERGGEAVGLYFDAALPDAIPVAPGSELDAYLPEGVAGATNAELQARFGFSFADALPPGDAVPVEGVIGGVAGTPLPPFEGFPPPIDPRLRIDDGGAGVGDDDDEEADDDAPVSIAFIGDSITDTGGEGFVEILQADVGEEAALMNFALGGSGLTDHALRWQDTEEADDFAESAPDIVWIMIGGNDIDPGNNGGASVEEYAAELDALVDDISAMESDPTVVIAAQPPFHAVDGIGEAVHETFREEWVPAMEQIAEDHDAAFVDVNAMVDDYPENYPDQIHPDEAGAETLAAIIGDALYEIVEQRADEAPEEDDEDEDDEAGFEGFFERVLERFGRDGEMPLRGRLEREEADGGEVGQFGGRAMRLRDRERDDEVAVTADTFRFFGGEADDALGDLGLTIDGDVPTLPAPRFLLAETLEPVEDGFCLDHFDF